MKKTKTITITTKVDCTEWSMKKFNTYMNKIMAKPKPQKVKQ